MDFKQVNVKQEFKGKPVTVKPPEPIKCFQCNGTKKIHRSPMSHGGAGCIFCKDCEAGCDDRGLLPLGSKKCPKCNGEGRVHESTMSHSIDCIFCTDCNKCSSRGWLENADFHQSSTQPCFKCHGIGKLHRTSMPHKKGCIFCTDCNGCQDGEIPKKAFPCLQCHGEGRYHESTMPHKLDCIFCTDCEYCGTMGWVQI